MYLKLKSINIAALTPSNLFSKTANIRLLMISGEVIFGMGIVILFTLLLPNAWEFNHTGFWCVIGTLVVAIIYGIVHMYSIYKTVPRPQFHKGIIHSNQSSKHNKAAPYRAALLLR